MTPSEPNGITGAATVNRPQGGGSTVPAGPAGDPRAGGSFGEPVAPEQEAIKAWIRNHEEVALVGAFAIGVFIGALMRS